MWCKLYHSCRALPTKPLRFPCLRVCSQWEWWSLIWMARALTCRAQTRLPRLLAGKHLLPAAGRCSCSALCALECSCTRASPGEPLISLSLTVAVISFLNASPGLIALHARPTVVCDQKQPQHLTSIVMPTSSQVVSLWQFALPISRSIQSILSMATRTQSSAKPPDLYSPLWSGASLNTV